MRRILLEALLSVSASTAIADPAPKEPLLVPPADATHFVVSTVGKHRDGMPDGRLAFRPTGS